MSCGLCLMFWPADQSWTHGWCRKKPYTYVKWDTPDCPDRDETEMEDDDE